ncbi:MAG: insulinase family protein [Nocardioidaceae bacterium]|nr:insulinase family protein [Nocardioidaceae bacterium]
MTDRLLLDQRAGSTRTLLTPEEGGLVRRTVLPGGLRVITEQMPGVRSASIGVWAAVGSRDETTGLAGASHFLEHLLFKGTRSRTALDISAPLEAVGGEVNAFTGKEYTCFHARVLDEDLPLAVDTLADMVTSSVIAAEDVEAERTVILEEIAMNDDDPDDVVHNLIAQRLWSASPLARPVAGSVQSINALTRAQVAGYYRRRYRPESVVVAVAGNVEHRSVLRRVRSAFGAGGWLTDVSVRPRPVRRGSGPAVAYGRGADLISRPTEQANLVLGLPGLRRSDERRFTASVLTAALGGGMSSRLFQEVREKRGLAYAVYSFSTHFADSGMLGVYAGCAPSRVDEVLSLCREQLVDVASRGMSDEEVERGRGQLRGSIVLGLEDSGSRMSRIAKADLVHGELLSIDEVLARVSAVTPDQVRELAAELLVAAPSLAVVGPFDDADRFADAVA